MPEFTTIDTLNQYQELIDASEQGEKHVILRYGGPCNEQAEEGDIHVFYGAPCNLLDKVDFGCDDQIILKYGAPCKPPYIIVKYGGPCAKFKG